MQFSDSYPAVRMKYVWVVFNDSIFGLLAVMVVVRVKKIVRIMSRFGLLSRLGLA